MNYMQTSVSRKLLLVGLLLFLGVYVSIFASSITIALEGTATQDGGTWMFNSWPPPDYLNYWSSTPNRVSAYQNLNFLHGHRHWVSRTGYEFTAPATQSYMVSEDTNILTSADQVKFTFGENNGFGGNFFLANFQHINTVNPQMPWDILGQAGDYRIYTGGICSLMVRNTAGGYESAMRLTNCYFDMTVPYPSPVGSGAPMAASGWGQIDLANSWPSWINEFNNGNNQVEFDFTSMSPVVQDNWGFYNNTLIIRSSTRDMVVDIVQPTPGIFHYDRVEIVDLILDINYNGFSNPTIPVSYFLNRINETPPGYFPPFIDNVFNSWYWSVGTNADTFSVDVTFDLADVVGIQNPANLVIANKLVNSENWNIYTPVIVSTNPLRIKLPNRTQLGHFAIASIGGNTFNLLPPALSNITVTQDVGQSTVTINWQDVPDANFYKVYASDTAESSGIWTEMATVPGGTNTWSGTVPENKKFFRVTSIR